MFHFMKNSQTATQRGGTILHFPPAQRQRSNHTASWAALGVSSFSVLSRSDVLVYSRTSCGFNLHSTNGCWYWTYFPAHLLMSVYLLWLSICPNILPILKKRVFITEFWHFIIYSRYKVFIYQIHVLQVFSPSLCLVFSKKRHFKFWWSPTYPFFLLWIILILLYLRNLYLIQGHKDFLLCFLLEVVWF